MSKQLKQLLRDVIGITIWITFMGTLAYGDVGKTPTINTPYEWWLVPLIMWLAGAPIFFGWKLRKDYETYKASQINH
jgi:hypothetical protein